MLSQWHRRLPSAGEVGHRTGLDVEIDFGASTKRVGVILGLGSRGRNGVPLEVGLGFDAADGADHDFVDADAFGAGERVADFAQCGRGLIQRRPAGRWRHAEQFAPPLVALFVEGGVAEVIGVAGVDDVERELVGAQVASASSMRPGAGCRVSITPMGGPTTVMDSRRRSRRGRRPRTERRWCSQSHSPSLRRSTW